MRGHIIARNRTANMTCSACAVLLRVDMQPPIGSGSYRWSCFWWLCDRQWDSLPIGGPVSRAYATADATRSPSAVLFWVVMPPPMRLAPYPRSLLASYIYSHPTSYPSLSTYTSSHISSLSHHPPSEFINSHNIYILIFPPSHAPSISTNHPQPLTLRLLQSSSRKHKAPVT